MNSMRKFLCVLTAVILAAFALQGFAADPPTKQYSLQVTASPVYTGDPQVLTPPTKVTLKYTNLSPPSTASSNIGSVSGAVYGLTIVDPTAYPQYSPFADRTGNVVVTSPTSFAVTNINPPVQGLQAITVTLYVSSCGNGLWISSASNGNNLNGSMFERKGDQPDQSNLTAAIKCGDLACDTTSFTVVPAFPSPDANNPGHVTVTRGQYDENGVTGTACTDLSFYFTNTISSDKKWHAAWPESGPGSDPFVALSYTVISPPGYSTTVPPTLSVAWLNIGGGSTNTLGTPDPGPLLPCLVPQVVPAPYGTLTADVSLSDKSIKIDTSTGHIFAPTIPPTFPAVIVDKDYPTLVERMEVTKTTTNTWTVTRPTGNTTLATHAAGALVMSTSMPIVKAGDGYSSQYIGLPAQMCLAGPMQQIQPGQWAATIFDFGDGFGQWP